MTRRVLLYPGEDGFVSLRFRVFPVASARERPATKPSRMCAKQSLYMKKCCESAASRCLTIVLSWSRSPRK